ncbi:aminodeoxychorismate lyase [Nitratifractor salsuginis DSM 16511]|uniref:Endolytic murein transglycosylase n=1 Tax=Nitratifractor salsuginis (strain DSM 16511 / JCM 12458 / E9I37-1) TaxID=749222 RepID=E6WY30_NITSE|nr:aminodeoxychorismate lyase [Nitratifractor salsuginis DSM 16511]
MLLLSFLYYLSLPVHPPKNLQISDSSIDSIISKLQKQGVEVGVIDRLILRRMPPPKRGWLYLGRSTMDRLEFLRTIGSDRGRFKAVTLIPGETTVIFLGQLAKALDKNATKLRQAYRKSSPYPEGGILAESYNIPLDYSESKIISYLVNLSQKRYRKLAADANLSYDPKSWQRILTIASIIQKEAADRREMPRVASVIYNRLAKHMRLQMDGTLNYGPYSHVRVTPERIREDNSTYNTYKHRGLPKAPVCNVSTTAIEAALHPAKTDYLYFFRNNRGKHDFFKNYKAHLKEVRKKRRQIKKAHKEKKRNPTRLPKDGGNPPARKATDPPAAAPSAPGKNR